MNPKPSFRQLIAPLLIASLCLFSIGYAISDSNAADLPLPEAFANTPAVSSDALATSKPVTIFGLYNCRGWAGVIVVPENGTVVGPLSMKPADAQAFAKKAEIAPEHQIHLFPAQGECAKVAPYESQLRGEDTQTT